MYPQLVKNSSAKEISKEDLDNFEKEFKILLPESFKKFLLENNGVRADFKYAYIYKGNNTNDYSNIVHFFDLDRIINCLKLEIESDENKEEQNDDDLFYVYDDSDYEYLSDNSSIFLKNKMLMFGETTGGTLCISYDEYNYGKIYEIDTSHSDIFVELSNNFNDFMSQFDLNPDYEENT